MEHLSVAIADDNQRILDMLDDIIQTDKELDLVGKAKNGEEMCQIIKDRQPDVVLLDLIMPKNGWIDSNGASKQAGVCRQKTVFYSAYCCRTGKNYRRCI